MVSTFSFIIQNFAVFTIVFYGRKNDIKMEALKSFTE